MKSMKRYNPGKYMKENNEELESKKAIKNLSSHTTKMDASKYEEGVKGKLFESKEGFSIQYDALGGGFEAVTLFMHEQRFTSALLRKDADKLYKKLYLFCVSEINEAERNKRI